MNYDDYDPGSSSESDSDSDSDSAEETKAPPRKPAQIRTGLKIVLPPRKRGSAVVAARNISEEPSKRKAEDDENDEDIEDMEEEEEETDALPTKYRKTDERTRSPLSASGRAGVFPIYAAYRCQIDNCDFAASTAQHLRHHMATAQHSRRLRATSSEAV